MAKADKMFEELGFEKEIRKYAEVFVKEKGNQIGFNYKSKCVYPDAEYITMPLLQAIVEKCKELGWYE